MHDAFEWWAYIVIPSFLGVATVFVSVVAVLVSRRATDLAGEVEHQRIAAAKERIEDARREKLQAMALEEARVLHRYAVERLRAPIGRMVSQRWGEPPLPRHASEQALVDAAVVLEQSLVPGAGEIFALTKFDLDNRWEHLPDALDHKEPGSADREDLRASLVKLREDRMFARIRMWGLDPEAMKEALTQERRMSEEDPDGYLSPDPA